MENEIQDYVSKLKELAVNAKILSEILETSNYKELPSWIQDKIAISTKDIGDIKSFVNQKIMSRSIDLLEITTTTTSTNSNNTNKGSGIVDSYLKASPQGKNLFKNSLAQLDKISTQLSTIKEGEDSSNQLKNEILNTIKKYAKLGVASSVIAATLASCEQDYSKAISRERFRMSHPNKKNEKGEEMSFWGDSPKLDNRNDSINYYINKNDSAKHAEGFDDIISDTSRFNPKNNLKEGEDSSNQLKNEILNTIKKYAKLGVASSVIAATLASCEDVARKNKDLKYKKDSIDIENYNDLRDSLFKKKIDSLDKEWKHYGKKIDSVHHAELKKPERDYDQHAMDRVKQPDLRLDYENIKHPGLDTSRFNPKNNLKENKQNTNMNENQRLLKEKYDNMYSKVKGNKAKVKKLNQGFKKLGLNETFFNMNTGKMHGTGFEDIENMSNYNSKFTGEQLNFITKVKELVDRMKRTVGIDKIFEILDYYIDNNMIIDLSDFEMGSNKIPVYENKQIKSLVDKIIKEEVSKVLKNKKSLKENMNDAALVDRFKKDLYDITCEPTDMNEMFDNLDLSQTSKLMNMIKDKFTGLDVDMNKIYDLTKKYIKMGLASAVIVSALSSCATECANEKISQRNNAKYGRKVKHNNSNAFKRQNDAQFRGARVNRR